MGLRLELIVLAARLLFAYWDRGMPYELCVLVLLGFAAAAYVRSVDGRVRSNSVVVSELLGVGRLGSRDVCDSTMTRVASCGV